MPGRTPLLYILAVSLACTAHLPAHAEPFAYVANLGSDNVTVIDTATNTVVATIAVGDEPDAIAVSPDGRRVYVSNFASHDVSVIDAASQRVTATIDVGRGPVGLVVSNDGDEVLVTNREDDTVSVIRTSSNRLTHTFPVGNGPNAVVITADGARAYVTSSSSTDPGVVSVINASYEREIDRINVLRNPNRIAAAPDGTVYVTNYRAWNVSLIDPDDSRVVDTFRVDRKPSGIAVSPDGASVYVVGKGGGITVYDTTTRKVSNWIYVPGRADGIATTRTSATAFVTNFDDDTVSVLDLNMEFMVDTVPVGDQPFAVAVNCAGRGCSAPPWTRIPTPTHTPYPTPTPTLPPARLSLSDVSGRPGDQVTLRVRLHTSGWLIAGTQSDILIGADVIDASSVRCRRNPDINKASTVFRTIDEGNHIVLRSLVLSLEDLDAIPDGAELFSCTLRLAASAPVGHVDIKMRNLGGATPKGGAIPMDGIAGRFEVLGNTRGLTVATPAISHGRVCTSGPNDGMPCLGRDRECGVGLCIIAQGICDGGLDDGMLCDCPGGRCTRSAAGATCVGGTSDGVACDTDANCAGAVACAATHKLCQAGPARGMACLHTGHCLDHACASARGYCGVGEFRLYGCFTDNDCPGSDCISLDDVPVPATSPSAVAAAGETSDGCAVIPQSSADAWVVVFGLAFALVARRWTA